MHVASSPSAMFSPSDAGCSPAGRGPNSTGVVVRGGVLGRQIPAPGLRDEARGGLSAPRAPIPVELVEPAVSLQPSDGLEDILSIVHRSVDEIFPANPVFMKCARCGGGIPRVEGYRHIKIGDKRTFCPQCHEAMGLPARAGGARPSCA